MQPKMQMKQPRLDKNSTQQQKEPKTQLNKEEFYKKK
jgi:hypothetical protein